MIGKTFWLQQLQRIFTLSTSLIYFAVFYSAPNSPTFSCTITPTNQLLLTGVFSLRLFSPTWHRETQLIFSASSNNSFFFSLKPSTSHSLSGISFQHPPREWANFSPLLLHYKVIIINTTRLTTRAGRETEEKLLGNNLATQHRHPLSSPTNNNNNWCLISPFEFFPSTSTCTSSERALFKLTVNNAPGPRVRHSFTLLTPLHQVSISINLFRFEFTQLRVKDSIH